MSYYIMRTNPCGSFLGATGFDGEFAGYCSDLTIKLYYSKTRSKS